MATMKAFFKGKNFLITGGTGFIGRSLVEKLLRTFACIGDIYMVVRTKKGESLEVRKEKFENDLVFNRIKCETSNHQELFKKIKWIEGDLGLPNLGISSHLITKLQSVVNIVVHSASVLNFNLPLKTYVQMCLKPTAELLEFSNGCHQLDCFLYMSTAVSQARRSRNHMTEEILPHPVHPRELLKMAATLTSDEMEASAPNLLADWVNYYTYCKNAAENLVVEYADKFGVVIYRPGIVVHSLTEPKPYWIANQWGFLRTLMEANRGLVIFTDPDVNANSVPVDYTTNGALAAIYRTSIDRSFKIYNFTTGNNPISFSKAFQYYCNSIPRYESELVKRRYELMNMKVVASGSIEEKLKKEINAYYAFQDIVKYFIWNKLKYDNKNIEVLWSQMSEEEKQLLPFDVRVIDWRQFYSKMNENEFGMPKLTLDI